MAHRPTLPEFLELAKSHSVVPVYRQLIGDTLTPVTAFQKIQEGDWSFLFESVVGGERLGRYSFLGAGPFLLFQAWDRHIVDRRPRTGQRLECDARRPARAAGGIPAGYRAPHLPGLPRFCGGAVGYAGYDTVRYVERLDHRRPTTAHLPDLCFAFYDRMVIFDHINKTIAVVAHAHVDAAEPAQELRRRLPAASIELVERLQQARCRPAAHRHRRRSASVQRPYAVELHARRLRGRPSRSARSTSRPATSSRSCSASA